MSTTSFRISQPPRCKSFAKRRASGRCARSGPLSPARPSERNAAQISTPRARRESSGRVLRRLAMLALRQICRGHDIARFSSDRIADEGEAAVVRHVEPLVRVRRPRVGVRVRLPPDARIADSPPPTGQTRHRRAPRRRQRAPRAKSPRRIERAGIHVARLHADNRRSAERRQSRRRASAPGHPRARGLRAIGPSRACPAL